MKISTSWAWVITMAIAVGAFVLRTFETNAPLELLYAFMGSIGGAYGFRRYKLKVSNNEKGVRKD